MARVFRSPDSWLEDIVERKSVKYGTNDEEKIEISLPNEFCDKNFKLEIRKSILKFNYRRLMAFLKTLYSCEREELYKYSVE